MRARVLRTQADREFSTIARTISRDDQSDFSPDRSAQEGTDERSR